MAPTNESEAARSIVITRLIDAPRELVFEAWTTPEHYARWWGPDGFTITTQDFEFREGGIWRFVMHGPDGRDYKNLVVWEEIVRPERIVHSHGNEDAAEPIRFRSTATFEDLGGKTRLTMTSVFPSAAERDRVEREHHAVEGGNQTVGRLVDYVAEVSGVPGAQAKGTFSRHYDAPRARVFAAWTDPKHLAKWWGPHGFTNPVCEFDARPGGAIRIDMTGPDGTVYPMTGTVEEVSAPDRLVFTAVARERDGRPMLASRTVVTLADDKGGTKVTVDAHAYAIVPAAYPHLKGMNEGWSQTLERLGTFLAG